MRTFLTLAFLSAILAASSSIVAAQTSSDLFEAVAKNDSAAVELLLREKPKLREERNEDSWTPLQSATFLGATRAAEALVRNGASISATDPDGETALHLASGNGHDTIVARMLSAGAEVNAQDNDGQTALLQACENGRVRVVNLLLGAHANTSLAATNGVSPILTAARSGFLGIVKSLIEKGVSLEERDTVKHSPFNGYTPLHFAVENGRTNLVDYLLLHGAHAAGRVRQNGDLPIHLAATWHSNDTIIDLLIHYGSYVNARNWYNQTPLHLAVWEDRPELAKHLLELGANANAQDSVGTTAMVLAAHAGRIEIVSLLLKYNGDPNLQNKAGVSPLMEATKGGFPAIMSVLLEHGADVGQKDSSGHDVLYYLPLDQAPSLIYVLQDALMKHLSNTELENAAKFYDGKAEPVIAKAIRNLEKK